MMKNFQIKTELAIVISFFAIIILASGKTNAQPIKEVLLKQHLIGEKFDDRTKCLPKIELEAKDIPGKENLWVFILAGQSNMAGRGTVEPQDTLPDKRILTINKEGKLIVAKEPIHFYEPNSSGLDCGLSFGKELLQFIPDSVSILLLPVAVGGSSISQWLEDSTFRGVPLFRNFREKVTMGQGYGTIKGILWHQGENDAKTIDKIELYHFQLKSLTQKFRSETKNMNLPILIGELGSFSEVNTNWQALNNQIRSFTSTDKNTALIQTADLKHKGDKVHFDSEGQRIMGQRFAKSWIELKIKQNGFEKEY